jgi:DNA-directed RNA polymerase subunit RPC12/RpoP
MAFTCEECWNLYGRNSELGRSFAGTSSIRCDDCGKIAKCEDVPETTKQERINILSAQLEHRTTCLNKVIVANTLLKSRLCAAEAENIELRRNLAKTHKLIVRCGYCGAEIVSPEMWSKDRAQDIMKEHLRNCADRPSFANANTPENL